jgi:hypothetical protein
MLDLSDDGVPVTAADAYDHNDKNWWCPLNLNRHLPVLRDEFDALSGDAAAQIPSVLGAFLCQAGAIAQATGSGR